MKQSRIEARKEMIMAEELEHFKSKSYDVKLRRTGNIFSLFVPDLSIVAEDESLEKAYDKLEKEKEKFFKKMIDNGLEDCIPEPGKIEVPKKPVFELQPFFVKLVIVLLLIGLAGGAGFKAVSSQIGKANKAVTKLQTDIADDLRGVDERIVSSIAKAGFQVIDRINTFPEEKRDKLRGELQKSMIKLKPFIDDFMMLFDYPETVRIVPDQTGNKAGEPSTK